MTKTYNFYDTSSLLLRAEDDSLFDENLVISTITLTELENIKTSRYKNECIQNTAKKLIKKLNSNIDKYEVVIFKEKFLNDIKELSLPDTPDTRILACAKFCNDNMHPDETNFITNDLSLANMANLIFGTDSIYQVEEQEEEQYLGYQEVQMTDEEMNAFYSSPLENFFDLKVNEYLIIKDKTGAIVDRLCWTGACYRALNFKNFKSKMFGDIKPISGDTQQMFAADSLSNNQITMIKGRAGSGKTTLALGYLISQLEKGKIHKIIVFCNTVATKDSAKLGFYPGDRNEKLLDSQIGNLLISKLGSRFAVERMIEDETLVLLPCSDIRGYDTSGMRAGVYISEAQNMSVSLMKLALQRIGKDSICIIDGDRDTQLDDIAFSGTNNGMRRASEVFRGTKVYGEVTLNTVHRSEIARIAEEM